MRLAAAIRKRLAPFLIVSAALHLVISLFLLLVPRHVQTRVVEQPAMKIYPAALLFAGDRERSDGKRATSSCEGSPGFCAGEYRGRERSGPVECGSGVSGVLAASAGGRSIAAA